MVTITPELVQEVARDLVRPQNRAIFMSRFMEIVDKGRHPVPFVPNVIQSDMVKWIEAPGGRNIAVKPSQVGASSIIIAWILLDTIFTPGTTSVIVAHEEFITQRLLSKAQAFYDSLPEDFRVPMHHKGSHDKSFPDINSVLYIGSARAYVFGRGERLDNFLADEYAFWPDTERIMVPALQRVPPEGRVIVLSTPNGEDNDFHDLYQEGKTGQSVWKSHFYPWFIHSEYDLRPDSPATLPADQGPLGNFTDLELALTHQGLSEGQIRWRRSKVAEMKSLRSRSDSPLLFSQEFPEDDVTCFLSSGTMVYDPDVVDELAGYCHERVDYIHSHNDILLELDVWVPPEDDKSYQVSIDPGQGKQTSTAVTVWTYDQDEQGNTIPIHCATMYGLVDEKETAVRAEEIGKLYNGAGISCEANGHGIAVLNGLLDYGSVYRRVELKSGRTSRVPGWLTTPSTKPYMISETSNLIDRMVVKDIRIVSQFRNIRWKVNARGEKIAKAMGADDLHDSVAIAMATRDTNRVPGGFSGAIGWERDW